MGPSVPNLRTTLLAAVLAAAAPGAPAQGVVDPLALQATDETPDGSSAASGGSRLEAWALASALRRGAERRQRQQRLVLDFRREWDWTPDWKLGLSSRLEQVRADPAPASGADETRHALREAYASWRWAPGLYLDAGRLQWRSGVASGSNPSDFLKRGAVLDLGTQNPQALRENRLGTVMLRQQWLGDWGSVQSAWIPKLSSSSASPSATPQGAPAAAAANPRSPAWERTNGADAALLRWAPRTPEAWSAEALVYARAGEPVRWAGNATALLGDSLVAYGEWAGGRTASRDPGRTPRHDQEWAAGATWTSPWGWTATLERQQATTPTGTDGWFARLAWDQAFGRRDLNVSAFARRATPDRSSLWQLDARWNLDDRHSLSLAWGGNHGAPSTDHGRAAVRRYGTVSWSVYF